MSEGPGVPGAPRLFDPEACRFRATGAARFRALVRRPTLPPTAASRRAQEDRVTMDKLRDMGLELARRFELRWKCLVAEQDGVFGHYGICYEDGEIRIRLRHARTGRLLKESSLVDTLCHELAHLRHLDHSERFRRLYERILGEARRLGWYRPGPADERRPTQLSLFGEGCGTGPRRRNGRATAV